MLPTSLTDFFYQFKAFIPRKLQILLRRKLIASKIHAYSDVWPIDPNSATPPDRWSGWPDGKRFALVLSHDIETKKGLDKCLNLMRLDQEMGFRSSFNFVPERGYSTTPELRNHLEQNGFEVGVHDLKHDGKLYKSEKIFKERAQKINTYLKDWGCVGFRSGAMHHNLEWIHDLDIEYDASTFDTDPFEPQPKGMGTIFPFTVKGGPDKTPYVELPYTLSQDFTLFVIMQEKNINIWKRKLDWIVQQGGMALLTTHPDYINFDNAGCGPEEYPFEFYKEFLEYVKTEYKGEYWNALPKKMARFWKKFS